MLTRVAAASAGCLQVGLSSQAEPECLPLAARRSPAPGTLLRHSLHKVLAAPSDAGTTPDALQGLAEVCCHATSASTQAQRAS